jgi:hypothetical protein
MPLVALTHSDRWLWITSFICFLLLPGLFFRVFRIAGVRGRVAWTWMWLLPAGYGFILQAGSIANDLPAVVFGLAAVDFAVRASRQRDFHLSSADAFDAFGGASKWGENEQCPSNASLAPAGIGVL